MFIFGGSPHLCSVLSPPSPPFPSNPDYPFLLNIPHSLIESLIMRKYLFGAREQNVPGIQIGPSVAFDSHAQNYAPFADNTKEDKLTPVSEEGLGIRQTFWNGVSISLTVKNPMLTIPVVLPSATIYRSFKGLGCLLWHQGI